MFDSYGISIGSSLEQYKLSPINALLQEVSGGQPNIDPSGHSLNIFLDDGKDIFHYWGDGKQSSPISIADQSLKIEPVSFHWYWLFNKIAHAEIKPQLLLKMMGKNLLQNNFLLNSLLNCKVALNNKLQYHVNNIKYQTSIDNIDLSILKVIGNFASKGFLYDPFYNMYKDILSFVPKISIGWHNAKYSLDPFINLFFIDNQINSVVDTLKNLNKALSFKDKLKNNCKPNLSCGVTGEYTRVHQKNNAEIYEAAIKCNIGIKKNYEYYSENNKLKRKKKYNIENRNIALTLNRSTAVNVADIEWSSEVKLQFNLPIKHVNSLSHSQQNFKDILQIDKKNKIKYFFDKDFKQKPKDNKIIYQAQYKQMFSRILWSSSKYTALNLLSIGCAIISELSMQKLHPYDSESDILTPYDKNRSYWTMYCGVAIGIVLSIVGQVYMFVGIFLDPTGEKKMQVIFIYMPKARRKITKLS